MANEFFIDEHTSVMQKLVREVTNDPATYRGSSVIPSVALPVRKIRTEVIEASGGLTNEHVIGTDTQLVQSFGTRVQEFEPPAYKEAILYDEKKILFLRELGKNDYSKRGIRQYIEEDVNRLNRRLEARIEQLRWSAIFTGQFQYLGASFSYGFISANNAVPVGALWSLDGVTANAAANPLIDLRYWLTGGYAQFRKYKVTKVIMNPNTARFMLDNVNTRNFLTSMYANAAISNYDINKAVQFVIPGCPEIELYEGWYQQESVDGTGKIVVGNATYMIPDGKIFLECALPGGDKVGEFVQGAHLASGSIDQPGFGKFLVMDECIAPGTRGGPQNPYLQIIAGVYGGVKIDRPFDVLTATVV